MSGSTRRGLLVGGFLSLSAAALGVGIASHGPGADTDDDPGPSRTASAPPDPTLAPLPSPTPMVTFSSLSTAGVMQDFCYLPEISTFLVTQRTPGSRVPYETVIINRVGAAGTTLDAMTLLDGGHGLGIEAEIQPDALYVWVTWQGASQESDWREHDFVRLRYVPGTWSRQQAVDRLGLGILPVKDDPEAQYRFDWKNDWAVERHYDWNGATETYKRRRISDIRNGITVPDSQLERLVLPVDPPTTQGFATIDDTFYRWLGTSTTDDVMDAADPIALQRFDWASGRLRSEQVFTDLSRGATSWPGGRCEPEGMSVFRESDGAATLLVGDTTGLPLHEHHVSAFARIAPG